MQYTTVLNLKLPFETTSQIYYCDVQFAMKVILRTVDCLFGIWKRLLEIIIYQNVTKDYFLFKIWKSRMTYSFISM